jgi:hypothetical protein
VIPWTIKLLNKRKTSRRCATLSRKRAAFFPGLQAVFGFQTIAVFNERFTDLRDVRPGLPPRWGLGLMVVAMGMLMTPAVYYRAQHGRATSRMVRMRRARASAGGLVPLAVGLSLDMLTVMSLATDRLSLSIAAAVATLLLFVGLWYLLPRSDPIQVAEPGS